MPVDIIIRSVTAPTLIDAIKDWQALIAGILTLIGGAFVFIEGRYRVRIERAYRLEDAIQDGNLTKSILERLRRACVECKADLEQIISFLESFFQDYDNGRAKNPPDIMTSFHVFDVILSQFSSRYIDAALYVELAELVGRIITLQKDHHAFFSFFNRLGATDMHTRRLPLTDENFRVADAPAAARFMTSLTSVKELSVRLARHIDVVLKGEPHAESDPSAL